MLTPELRAAALRRLNETAGSVIDPATESASRMKQAEDGRTYKPYFLVVDLGATGNMVGGNTYNYHVPDRGLKRDTVFTGIGSSWQDSTVHFNIVKRQQVGVGVTARHLLSKHSKAGVFMGDFGSGANRLVAPGFADIEPLTVAAGEAVDLEAIVLADPPAAQACADTHVVLRGTQQYPADSADSLLTAKERAELSKQIEQDNPYEQIIAFDVDENAQDVQFPTLKRYSLLLGLASVRRTGDDFLHWSLVTITDWSGHDWSNAPIPLHALCALPYDNKLERYRYLDFAYLIPPGANRLTLSFESLPDKGALELPANMAEAAEGRIAAKLLVL